MGMKKRFFLFVTLAFAFHHATGAGPSSSGNKKIFPSNPTDHFRSVQTGDWASTSTWESSPDNTTWSAATLAPTSAASTIRIRNTHTVTISSNQDMDEGTIESGGILFHSAGTLTVNDGTGDDIIVLSGGIFTLASNSNGPVFSGTASANINTGGMLRLSASGLTNAGAGVHASAFIYQHASVLEYTLNLAFASTGVTFFPNVDAVTIPIFRITGNVGLIGGALPTVINGLFEANGSITFSNTGTKTFRNGIIGTGNIGHDGTSGKFIINGTTGSLGGSGTLTLPAGGMDIGSNTTVTMVSDKSITGNIALLSNALVVLGTYNLTMTGDVTGGSVTSHVVTNGSGKLFYNNVVALSRIFPIGANSSTINPVSIANGSGLNYGARVEIGINPSIRFPIAAVNRTWIVRPSGNPVGAVNVNFFYNNTAGNALFMYAPVTVEQGFYTGVWNVINTGLTQFGGPTNFQVTSTVSSFAANTDAPMVLGNIPAILQAGNGLQLSAQKQQERILLSWTVLNASWVDRFIAERSPDGRNYSTMAELTGQGFTDMQPMPGLNYYRIKAVDKDGGISYSNVAVVLNAASGFELIGMAPNPVVNGRFNLNISAAQKTMMEIVIMDMQGRRVDQQRADMSAGFNTVAVHVARLAKGTYQVYGVTGDGRSRVLRFVVQ